jgi:hypothetical protein
MKKVMLLSITLLGLTWGAKAQGIFEVTKKNGSAKGYDHITQHTDSLGNTTMTCTGPGQAAAEFVTPPNSTSKINYNKIMAYAESRIKQGKLSGSEVVSATMAKWEGKDMYNYTLRIEPIR